MVTVKANGEKIQMLDTCKMQQARPTDKTFRVDGYAAVWLGSMAPGVFPVMISHDTTSKAGAKPMTVRWVWFRTKDRPELYEGRDTELDWVLGAPGKFEDTNVNADRIFATKGEALTCIREMAQRRLARMQAQLAKLGVTL